MKNILVAVDKKKDAETLASHAVKLAKLTNAKIWIIHVTNADPDDFLAREAGPQYKYEKRAEERKRRAADLKQWTAEFVDRNDVDAEDLLIEGPVAKSIKKIVDEHNIDLVVAGHKKRNLFYGMFGDNKKKDLIDELQIPLLAIPLG